MRNTQAIIPFILFLLFHLSNDARADAVCGAWPDGTVCFPQNPCLGPGLCKGGACVSQDPVPAGTYCGAAVDACHGPKSCDGQGTCVDGPLLPAGTFCGSSGSPCLGDRVCDASGQCLPGARMPTGTICAVSPNPCRQNYTCDDSGQCLPGAPLAAGTVCGNPQLCRAQGLCDNAGTCISGQPTNEGRPCVGADVCQNTVCLSGTCRNLGPRDCSNGDPCRKSDACQPGVGCIAINICDLADPADLMSLPDQAPKDLGAPDARPDQAPLDAAAPDAADGGLPRGPNEAHDYRVRYEGGACQCQAVGGRGGADSVLGVLMGVLLFILRRRR